MSSYRLADLPATFQTTRDHLHQIAFYAISPVRYQAVERMGLRHLEGGFGTPEFDGKVLRVEGNHLVVDEGAESRSLEISTIRRAAQFLGREYEQTWFEDFHDPLQPIDPDQELRIDPESTRVLSEWYRYGWDLLAELSSRAVTGDDPSEVQLWPEHFDVAVELGSQEEDRRASYGASPGDPDHPEPYLYVAAWGEIDRADSYWNDESFNGSSLGYGRLQGTSDPLAAGLDFLLEGYRILRSEAP